MFSTIIVTAVGSGWQASAIHPHQFTAFPYNGSFICRTATTAAKALHTDPSSP